MLLALNPLHGLYGHDANTYASGSAHAQRRAGHQPGIGPLPDGCQRWRIRFDPAKFDPDITVAIRLDATNTQELDYYLLPRLDLPEQEIHVSNKNSADFECFRFDDLNFFYGMSERERLQRRI